VDRGFRRCDLDLLADEPQLALPGDLGHPRELLAGFEFRPIAYKVSRRQQPDGGSSRG
jgi:hypothetical protein